MKMWMLAVAFLILSASVQAEEASAFSNIFKPKVDSSGIPHVKDIGPPRAVPQAAVPEMPAVAPVTSSRPEEKPSEEDKRRLAELVEKLSACQEEQGSWDKK